VSSDPRRRSREHWIVLVLVLAAPVGLVALGRALEPDPRGWGTHEQLGFQPCWPMSRWNVPCPGCGVTTALAHATRGSLIESLRTQPFGLVLLAGSTLAAGWALASHARGRDLFGALTGIAWTRLASALGLLLVLAWLYKLASARGWPG
jgi:hypothetical protein